MIVAAVAVIAWLVLLAGGLAMCAAAARGDAQLDRFSGGETGESKTRTATGLRAGDETAGLSRPLPFSYCRHARPCRPTRIYDRELELPWHGAEGE